MLAKGPVAVALWVIPLVLWLTATGTWRIVRALPWVSGLARSLLLTLPWYLAAEAATPGFLRYFIIGEHFERFTVSGWEGDLYGGAHVQPKDMI